MPDHPAGPDGTHPHRHRHDHRPSDDGGNHDHHLGHHGDHHHDHRGPRPEPAAGDGDSRRVRIERDLLAENDRFAAANRAFLSARGAVGLNLLSGPGAGKTTLLERTIADLSTRLPLAVVEGDQQTSFDADRIERAGGRAVQINTGRMCHLDAHMVGHALDELALPAGAVVFIENIGNLVCPAAFDLGEVAKVVLLSVTEGDDKPRKYADMFRAADLMLLTKIDLLPYVSFDLDRAQAFARTVNPRLDVLTLSARTGDGLSQWYDWIERQRHRPAVALAGE
jgi:hydrogenase nickel incorporation protein HypB